MSENTFDFNGKTALLFGGANGIGQAVALEFARRGAQLVVADIDIESAQKTAADIKDAGGKALAISCDVTSDDSVQEAAAEAEKALGELDVVMNNVGVILQGNPEDIPLQEWRRVVELNLFSTLRSNDIFVPKMLARGSGYIVNTASFAGLYPYASSRLPYVASKAAVVGMSESLALHLLPRGVHVSCFCPGPVMTNVSKNMKSWSDDIEMRGPGSQFKLMTADESAVVLADGMEKKKIFIPTHAEVLAVMQDHAKDPDKFVHTKIEEFKRGENGLPVFKPQA